METAHLSENTIKEILTKYRVVAVVGLSRDPSKTSYSVAEYLKAHGFRILPINPLAQEVLGEKCYTSLLEMPTDIQKSVEIVDIFRPSDDVPQIVEQVIQMKRLHGTPFVLWMQLGITNEQAAEKAEAAGLMVIMDHCIMKEHKRLFGGDF